MFESPAQRLQACRVLAGLVSKRVQGLLDESGPLPGAFHPRVRERLSSGERVWLDVCLAIWNAYDSRSHVNEIFHLDSDAVAHLGKFLQAYAENTVAEWIKTNQREECENGE